MDYKQYIVLAVYAIMRFYTCDAFDVLIMTILCACMLHGQQEALHMLNILYIIATAYYAYDLYWSETACENRCYQYVKKLDDIGAITLCEGRELWEHCSAGCRWF